MKKITFIIAVVLLGLMASCTEDTTIERVIEVEIEHLYYFKAKVREVTYNYSEGRLYHTHAIEKVLSEKHGILFSEVKTLLERYDLGIVRTETDDGGKHITVIEKIYRVEYNRTH